MVGACVSRFGISGRKHYESIQCAYCHFQTLGMLNVKAQRKIIAKDILFHYYYYYCYYYYSLRENKN